MLQSMPMNKKWEFLHPQEKPVSDIEELIKILLLNRKIASPNLTQLFFNATIQDFEADLALKNLSLAAERISKAIKNKEQIIVYGDYDVDGLCATAIVYLALKSLNANILPFIPHRESEGYGLSIPALEKIIQQGGKLIITVDNGIVAFDQAKFAKNAGVDLIITDHHARGESDPEGIVVHSHKICGAAVAWCLMGEMIDKTLSGQLLDLVAIATVCDMMPLLGVNRYFVKEGLKQMRKTQWSGLKALIFESRLNITELNSHHIGYILGPRLNAVGRLGQALDGLRLLCTQNPIQARGLASNLSQMNSRRRELTDLGLTEARNMVLKLPTRPKVLILNSPNWLPGIIGLIAGKLVEEFGLPVLAISRGETVSRGSARSIKGLDITKLLREFGQLLVNVGGHEQAAGFTLETAKIASFSDRLTQYMEKVEINWQPSLELEALVEIGSLDLSWQKQLATLEPFGLGNRQPVLAGEKVVLSNLSTVGMGKHLRFKANGIPAIAFGKGELLSKLKENQPADLAFCLENNQYNGQSKLQLKVVDVHL